MSEAQAGRTGEPLPGWWQASDDLWYPPESHPDALVDDLEVIPDDDDDGGTGGGPAGWSDRLRAGDPVARAIVVALVAVPTLVLAAAVVVLAARGGPATEAPAATEEAGGGAAEATGNGMLGRDGDGATATTVPSEGTPAEQLARAVRLDAEASGAVIGPLQARCIAERLVDLVGEAAVAEQLAAPDGPDVAALTAGDAATELAYLQLVAACAPDALPGG